MPLKLMAKIRPHVDSIAAALLYQRTERAAVTRATGLQFNGDRLAPPPYLIHCRQPSCTFVGSATTEGRAISALCAHIVSAHRPEGTAA